MDKIEINVDVITGKVTQTVIQLTAEEIAALPIPVPPTYSELRAAAYPSFADQFDTIFHGGIDAWKAEIQVTKNKYPKEVA
jgi:hypothetical protein